MKNKTLNDALTVMLKDGRQLGYAEYGDPEGKPILFFHGFPGSRLEPSHLQNIALSNHYRLIGGLTANLRNFRAVFGHFDFS